MITCTYLIAKEKKGEVKKINPKELIELKIHIMLWLDNKIPNEWFNNQELIEQQDYMNTALEILKDHGY